MPTVISKYLEDTALKYNINKQNCSKAIVAAAVLMYGCKLSYPLVQNIYNRTNKLNYSKFKCGPNESSQSGQSDSEDEKLPPTNNNMLVPNGYVKNGEYVDNKRKLKAKQKTPGFNKEFIIQLYKLVRLMIPGIYTPEVGLLILHTLALVTRTFMSIYVATMEGRMVKFIVKKDVRSFSFMLLKWLGIALPATFLNSTIRYLENKLALAFRTRLVNHSYARYFQQQTYYRVSNLDGRIENADHRLTEDISAFTSSVAHLYSHLTKPLFDCALIGFALMRSSREMGAAVVPGPLLAFVVVSLTGQVLRVLSPKFGALVAVDAERSAYLRNIHSRVITNAEEIAFYGGHKVELGNLRTAYASMVRHKNRILVQRLWYVVLEQFLMKYVWSGTGMIMISLPIIMSTISSGNGSGSGDESTHVSERTQYLTTARNLLVSGADAVERLMSSYKEIVELAGYTSRVAHMLEVFDQVSQGQYQKTTVAAKSLVRSPGLHYANGQIVIKGEICDSPDGSIELQEVPIVTPNMDVVVPSLSLRVTPGSHLLITGPNGCGKSSLFRVLSGLWPVYAGRLIRPRHCTMFYVPQRPYMTLGSLREQVIYPETLGEWRIKGVSDAMLEACLEKVSLAHLVVREGGWDSVADWKDVLSGGEKQRMALARLFYHKPAFALLDECTSAVSIDVESSIYQTAKDLGITLLTITHRPSLWKFHSQILQFDGDGKWSLSTLTQQEKDTGVLRESMTNS
uniref:ABC transporter domain-containing protein n=1 Tax=Cuerna arida TaxID=1464854 RepID=A0A1B6GNJ2_9HEMI